MTTTSTSTYRRSLDILERPHPDDEFFINALSFETEAQLLRTLGNLSETALAIPHYIVRTPEGRWTAIFHNNEPFEEGDALREAVRDINFLRFHVFGHRFCKSYEAVAVDAWRAARLKGGAKARP